MMFDRNAFAWLALLAFVGPIVAPTRGAESPPGQAIYKKHCVRCHGKAGEGVKGKYDDALHGDWSLEKLTRYIEKSMPEDDPDKINGADVESVARHIHDTFYSQEARARNHPARVELVRLTNRQYVNMIADLLRGFEEDSAASGDAQRGLRGNYRPRNRGTNNNNRRTGFERVDHVVNLTFGTNSPDAESLGTGTNEFSVNWRGSVLAPESGDYEFRVQSPNGVRLWVNDQDQPLIDAGVASGDQTEYKGHLRLIGGRAYALRMEYFKAPKDKVASVSLRWKPPHGGEEVIPSRQLSTSRAPFTFVVATPFPPDDSSVGYERGVLVSKAWDEATTQSAIEVANHVIRNLDRLSQSKPSDTNRTAKLQTFCDKFVTAAFRRPLSPQQKKEYIAAHFKKAVKSEDAVKRVVLLALKSPRFLYLGLEGDRPDDFEVAARLSCALWDSSPDRELLELAGRRSLHTREQVEAQTRRLLADARARDKVKRFLHHWLQVNHVDDLTKDSKLYPGFSPEIVGDLRTSLDLFLDDVVWSDSSDYRRLLLEDDLYVNNRLAEFYGISTNAADEFIKVSLDPKQRSGVITHPYLLAAFSYQRSSSPIHRGVFLTRNIVGRALKAPPMAVAFKESDFKPDMTMREKVAELTRPQACQGCHSVINPLGFSLENYDAVGRFRVKEGERAIDAASEYTTDDGSVVKLTGARDLAEFAVSSEHAQNAFIEQLFHQIVKQPMLAYGRDVPARLRQSFVKSGYSIRQLLIEISAISALHNVPSSTKNKS
ncbi:MAG TPA: DUF1592 domain-containing protein [Verrucomicrobiae bacterium]|nr:DUF1592 domain-containing protein [Verrucomicrobiae bacterium]